MLIIIFVCNVTFKIKNNCPLYSYLLDLKVSYKICIICYNAITTGENLTKHIHPNVKNNKNSQDRYWNNSSFVTGLQCIGKLSAKRDIRVPRNSK
jgi:hypothetical protein